MNFIELLEAEYTEIDKQVDHVISFLKDSSTPEEFEELVTEMFGDDAVMIIEALVKRVSSDGTVRKTLNRAIRKRRATLTTGMSKSALRIRGRKAARTRKRSAGTVRRAIKKRRKALRKRKQFGIK